MCVRVCVFVLSQTNPHLRCHPHALPALNRNSLPPPLRCQGFRPILLRLYQEAGNPLRMKKVKELYAIKAKTARRARKESKRKSKRGKVPSVTC